MIDLKEVFLFERSKIGSFVGDISVRIDINKTEHANDRQSRHGEADIISDEKIKKIVEYAHKKILNALITNKIDIGDTIVIRDMSSYVNLVCRISPLGDNVEVVVITVMKKSDFRSPDFQIQVWTNQR